METKLKRFLSLDVLRGVTVAGMILVNNPGSWGHIFAPLKHSAWNGCTPTDLVFPFFLFIVGAAAWFSMRKSNHELTSPIFWKVLKRGGLIFLTGLLLNYYPFFNRSLEHLRILGVLQRIGIVFTLGTLLALWLKTPARILAALGVLLLGYWALIHFTNSYGLENNFLTRVNIALLGEKHIYHGYGTPFEPEGLIGSISGISTFLLGYLAGRHMGLAQNYKTSVLQLAGYGIACIGIGLLWNPFFPINKPIWSSSYVLYAGGWAMLVWALLSFILDYEKKTQWATFFRVFGSNALFAFLLSGVIVKTLWLIKWKVGEVTYTPLSWLYQEVYSSFASANLASLFSALTMVLICWLCTWPLYRKKIFIKL